MINIVLKKGCDYEEFKTLLADQHYTYKQFGLGRVFTVETDLESFTLKTHKSVESCSENKALNLEPQYATRTLPVTHHRPTESITEDSWAMARICRRNNPYYNPVDGYAASPVSTEYAWDRTGNGVDCYLIDAGIHPSHPAFTGRLAWVSDGSTTREDVTPQDHGTAVASNMAGVGVGLATDALIWFVQSAYSGMTEADWIQQYNEVLQHYLSRANTNRPAVLNHSFGGGLISAEHAAAIAMMGDLIDSGIVVCASAGNFNLNADTATALPAEYDPDMIVAGSHGPVDSIMDFASNVSSNRIGTTTGQAVDIYAPGVGVACANGQNGYIQQNGTSFSSPYTAGVIALMMEGYQRLTHREQVKAVVRKLIYNSTKGKLRYNPNERGFVHNRILYVDPTVTFEEIPGLEVI